MRTTLFALSLWLGAACAHNPDIAPPQDDYVTRIPRDCAASDLSLEVQNLGPYALEVYWVVGRRSDRAPSARYRVGRGAPGRTVVKVSENVGRLILSNVYGHWLVPPVKNYGNGYSLTLSCVATASR